MPIRLRFFVVVLLCLMLASARAQTTVEPQVLSIPGAGPPTALLRALADAFNQQHAPHRIEIPQASGMASAVKAALESSALARMPRRLTQDEEKQGLRQIVVARQALVFVTGADVSVTGLSRQQLADAFSGRISTWAEGNYPLYLDAVLIFKAQPQGLARQFLDFIASSAGRAVIEAQGSLPVGKS